MANRYEGTELPHLYMILDDIRTKMTGIKEHGNALENGHGLFCLVGQKIEVERAIAKAKGMK